MRTLLVIKRMAKDGKRVCMIDIAGNRSCTRRTVITHVEQLRLLRLVSIVGQSSRGMMDCHVYLLDDEHFARFLYKKPKSRCEEIFTPVHSVQVKRQGEQKERKIISLEEAKKTLRKQG